MTSLLKASVCAGLASVALLCAVAQPAHAAGSRSAATPCWKVLLNDWYDGRIDGSYPLHCYNQALKHLPADVSTYSSAHDDILRALQSATAKQRKLGHKVGPNTLLKPAARPKKKHGGGTTTTGTTPTGRKPDPGLAGKINPGSPSSLPVPLLVLGGLALLLVAAGGAGLVAKRIQARRQNP